MNLEFETKEDVFALFEEITLLKVKGLLIAKHFPKILELHETLQEKADKQEI